PASTAFPYPTLSDLRPSGSRQPWIDVRWTGPLQSAPRRLLRARPGSALGASPHGRGNVAPSRSGGLALHGQRDHEHGPARLVALDRKSTRLNSSHVK